MDVKTTILHGELEEKIYVMKQPEGYIQESKENKMCLLKKSLYGLKQSPRQWYKQFYSFMIKVRYNRCEYDSVYFKQSDDLTYVDDMLITAETRHMFRSLKLSSRRNLT